MLVMKFGCDSGSLCRRVGFDDVIRGCRVNASDLFENTAVASTRAICVYIRLWCRRVGLVQNTIRPATKFQANSQQDLPDGGTSWTLELGAGNGHQDLAPGHVV